MRYILFYNSAKPSMETIINIQKYLLKVTGLYIVFKMFEELKYIEFKSYPFTSNVLFLKGENITIFKYIKNMLNKIKENNIVLITCYIPLNYIVTKKNLYQCRLNLNKAELYDNEEFGFGFEVTEAELKLYKSKQSTLLKKVEESFERKNKNGKFN